MTAAREVDLVVVGAGFAGMVAAIAAKQAGLEVVLIERSRYVGGTTAASAGTLWVPATALAERAGLADTPQAANAYLDAAVPYPDDDGRRAAFIEDGSAAVGWLMTHTDVRLSVPRVHPDYASNLPGAVLAGRALSTVPIDGRLCGDDFKKIRPPRRELTALGGMMVARRM